VPPLHQPNKHGAWLQPSIAQAQSLGLPAAGSGAPAAVGAPPGTATSWLARCRAALQPHLPPRHLVWRGVQLSVAFTTGYAREWPAASTCRFASRITTFACLFFPHTMPRAPLPCRALPGRWLQCASC
jgi:hypothetical protein